MSGDIEHLVYMLIEKWASGRKDKRFGIVTSYDPKTHRAKVKFQPEGNESGWLPIHAHHMGNGWGVIVGLTPGNGETTGDLVEVSYQEGNYESGSITSRVHSDVDKAPQVQSGEMLLQHQKGHKIMFDKDGNITIAGSAGSTTVHDKDGNITHTDKDGGVVHQSGGKVYLGTKTASKKVKLEDDSAATKVYGV